VTPASLGILTFRRRGAPGEDADVVDRRNERIVAAIADGGEVLLTSTTIRGRYAIRLCVLNHSSTSADVQRALDLVATTEAPADDPRAIPVPERAARQAASALEWLHGPTMTVDELRSCSPFANVGDEAAGRFLSSGRDVRHEPGDVIVERWSRSRTFSIVREGRLSVRIGDREVRQLGPGDHLGEIAAIDWGRDFSYGRTATVVALESTRLFVAAAASLRELMGDEPEVDRAIRRIAQSRLATR
jgi:hypothetical protein